LSVTTISRTVTGATPSGVSLRSLVRTDTGAAVAGVSTPAAFDAAGGGVYTFSFTDPAPGLTYRYVYRVTFASGQLYEVTATSAGAASDAPAYLTVSEAAALAATLPASLLAAFLALGSDAAKAAALAQATADVDAAGPWQGRRYAAGQALEFPRVPWESAEALVTYPPAGGVRYPVGNPSGLASAVWDWDAATHAPVVPRAVKVAVLHQANAIAAGTRAERLDAQHDGLASQSVGGLSESYLPAAGGGERAVCRAAAQLLRPYRLRGGRML
jgi:hypothetical protein